MENSVISIILSALNLIVITWFIYRSNIKDKSIKYLVKRNRSLSESLYFRRWESDQHEKEIIKIKLALKNVEDDRNSVRSLNNDLYSKIYDYQLTIHNMQDDLDANRKYIKSLKKNQRPKTTSNLNDFKK